jgi:hypothetical protein
MRPEPTAYEPEPLPVAQGALARLASALVADDDLSGDLSLQGAVDRLSEQDRTVLVNIVARIATVEAREGAAAAGRKLDGVLAILTGGRLCA